MTDQPTITLPTDVVHLDTAALIAADMVQALYDEFKWAALNLDGKKKGPNLSKLEDFARCYVQICSLYPDEVAEAARKTTTYKEIVR